MAMQAVYWALGIHDPEFVERFGKPMATYKMLQAKAAWAVLSFRTLEGGRCRRAGRRDRRRATRSPARGATRSRSIDGARRPPDPTDMHTVLVEMLEQAQAYVSGNTVLIQRENGPWVLDQSMPT